jgi:hypothetical protein
MLYFCSRLSIWPMHYRSHLTISYLLRINFKFDPSTFKDNDKRPLMKFHFKVTPREKCKCQCGNQWAVMYEDTTCFYHFPVNYILAWEVCHIVIHRWRMQVYLQIITYDINWKIIPLFYHAVWGTEVWNITWNKESSLWIRWNGNVLFQYDVSKRNVSENVFRTLTLFTL